MSRKLFSRCDSLAFPVQRTPKEDIEMAKKDASANSDIQIFCYKAMPVRTVEINGDTWFVAKDVADILEFEDATHAVRGLDEDEKALRKVETPGGIQDMTIISEAGLYTLLMRSNKEEAKPFRRWVTHDVLPSIRKTRSYTVSTAQEKPEKKSYMSTAWVKAVSKIIDMAFSAKTDADFQKALALDNAFKRENGYSALEAADIHIDTVCYGEHSHDCNWNCIDWQYHYKLVLGDALKLPEEYSIEFYDD